MEREDAPGSRSRPRRLLFGLVTAAIAVLLLELFAGLALRAHEGEWIGLDTLHAARAATATGERGDTLRRVSKRAVPIQDERVLHPYLGYVMDPRLARPGVRLAGLDPLSIELGFPRNTEPVIQPADPARAVIGLFGGSVADILSVAGADALRTELAKAPAFRGREILLLSAAAPGYKQPQALMALNYLLVLGAHFDAVVNLDGVNELTLPATELAPLGVPSFYPRGWYARASHLSPRRSVAIGRITYLERLRRRSARMFSGFPLRLSLTAGLAWRLADRLLVAGLADAEQELLLPVAGRDAQAQGPAPIGSEPLEVDTTEIWSRSSLQMAALCESLGIPYFHFLQPNQYVPDSKPMGEAERETAFREDSPLREPIEQGYPLLRTAGARLVAQGVAFTDLSGVFHDVTEPVYADDCCHLDERGNRLLGAAIGRAIANTPGAAR